MKAWFGAVAILAALMAGLHSANAAPGGFSSWLQAPDQGQARKPTQRALRDQRGARQTPQRDQRQDSRLTDEERRELRRDIDKADRDIYRRQRDR